MSLKFVSKFSQQAFALGDFIITLDALGAAAVDYAEDAAALRGFGEQHFRGIGGGAKNPADFRHVLHGFEHVDGKGVAEKKDEAVPGAEGLRILFRQLDALLVRAAPTHQARSAGFTERHAEFDARHGAN